MRTYLRARATGAITGINLKYEGSITLGADLCIRYGLDEGEQVDVLNTNNGNRFTTYVIRGNDSEIVLNGACARLGLSGDRVIILAYEVR